MANKKKKGVVSPSNSLIWPGTELQFRLIVGKSETKAKWSLSESSPPKFCRT